MNFGTVGWQLREEVGLVKAVGGTDPWTVWYHPVMGYDAGYYSYAWCDAVAADLAEHFEVGEGWPARPGNGRNKLEYDGAGLGLGVWTT